jgi:hypothetical protein
VAYQINHYNGTTLTTVLDGVIDNTLDIKLVGKNSAGYGEAQNENFVFLLENFASTAAPSRAIQGQIWYDSSPGVQRLKVYDGNGTWHQNASILFDPNLSGKVDGDLYWNSTDKKLYVYSGGSFNFIGPQRIPNYDKTELESKLVQDTASQNKPIIQAVLNGFVVYVISDNADFQLAPNSLTGFDWIKKGITLRDDVKLNGISTHAEFLVDKVPDDFIYSANPTFSVIANFADAGFNVNSKLLVSNISNIPTLTTTGSTLQFKTQTANSLTLINADIIPGTPNVSNIGSSGSKWNNLYANYVYSTAQQADSLKVNQVYRSASVNGNSIDTIVVRDSNANINSTTFTGDLVGNASSATVLATARTINSVSFDGSSSITITALTTNSLNPGTDIVGQSFNGSSQITWNVDSSSTNTVSKIVKRDSSGNFSAGRITASLIGNLLSSSTGNTVVNTTTTIASFTGSLIGNADTATKLATVRTINGVNFDGTQSITIVDASKVNKSGDTMTGFLTLNANPSSNLHAATKQYVDTYGCPTGVIVMWSGNTNTIPTGWALCNGQTVNNLTTPDLRNKFIIGAGNSYSVGQTGGSTSQTSSTAGSHSHTSTTGATSLTTGQLPSHQHTFTDVYAIVGDYGLGGSTASDRDRNGTYIYPSIYAGNASDGDQDNGSYGFPSITDSVGSSQGHSHSINTDGSHSHTVTTVPPYYALAYIMKVV